jgi:hypothetical protein
MTDCRVTSGRAAGRFLGSGFVLTTNLAVTANHVVRGRSPDELTVHTAGGKARVLRLDADEEIDAAVLHLDQASLCRTWVGDPVAAAPWVITTGPQGNDPQLSGTVATAARTIVNDRGHPVSVLQLDVAELVDDYAGYSGSAIRLRRWTDVVIGMLCEQLHSRLNNPGGGRPRATNVLYGIPIDAIVRRFAIAAPSARSSFQEAYRRVVRLIEAGDLPAADQELSRIPAAAHSSPTFWYLRSRVALARENLVVTAAYLREALRLDCRHTPSIAAKIHLLLLGNEPADRRAAFELAERSRSISNELDVWLKCLSAERMFDTGIRTATDLATRCPFPWYDLIDDCLVKELDRE